MPLDPKFLNYEKRRYGMDHDLYDWSMLTDREPVQWPDGKRVALWVNVALQYFPLNQAGKPFAPWGGMTTSYPDLRHYTLRDYGNRVGIFRFLKAFDRYGVKATYAMSARLAERVPYLVRKLSDRGEEIICHGWHMDAPHYGGMDESEEAGLVEKSLDVLRKATGQKVAGWISPSKSQSGNTPGLLVANGVEYMCDWINDDMPYEFRTPNGPITAMPLSTELDDRFILQNNLHSESEYADQIIDAFDYLYEESATQGGRMLALSLHPWMLGQPHRIRYLEKALDHIMSKSDVWSATASEIRRHAIG